MAVFFLLVGQLTKGVLVFLKIPATESGRTHHFQAQM